MNAKSKLKKSELIPSQTDSLEGKKSGLNKRGLKLIHGSKKQQVRVIIGCCDDDGISEYLSDLVKEASKNKYDLKVFISFYSEEILELADREAIDIFILILNNIDCFDYPIRERMENSLELITQIKSTYERPVIALSGWTEDFTQIERVELIADFFFPLPFEPSDIMEAVEESFDMLYVSREAYLKRL
jgi:DNA-binding NarL/FixJ family response regulator